MPRLAARSPARSPASSPKPGMWSLLRVRSGRALLLAVCVLSARPAAAQSVERFTIDSVVSVDSFGGDNISSRPQMVVDISTGMRIDDHWQVIFRPWFRRLRPPAPGADAPDAEAAIFQAGLRYERSGAIWMRGDLC